MKFQKAPRLPSVLPCVSEMATCNHNCRTEFSCLSVTNVFSLLFGYGNGMFSFFKSKSKPGFWGIASLL